MNEINETWKPVDGYEGIYEVSDQGRIRNSKRDGRIMTQSKVTHGYRAVHLSKDGKTRSILVHRLVAKAFIPNPSDKAQVNHKYGIKSNNRVLNLEWSTPRENLEHARNTGLIPNPPGPRAATTMIKLRVSKGWSQKKLAEMSGVGWQTIQSLERNERLIRDRCVSTIHKIAKALGVTIETLAGYDERG